MKHQQKQQMATAQGFIATLDQSGGSTPKALTLFSVGPERYADSREMFDLIHAMRTRIVCSGAFSGDKILGAILFEQTMGRHFDGQPSADYLWEQRGIVPFLKIDKGMQDSSDGVKLMVSRPKLDKLLTRAVAANIFGTKMRSVINAASPKGIKALVAQQFCVAKKFWTMA